MPKRYITRKRQMQMGAGIMDYLRNFKKTYSGPSTILDTSNVPSTTLGSSNGGGFMNYFKKKFTTPNVVPSNITNVVPSNITDIVSSNITNIVPSNITNIVPSNVNNSLQDDSTKSILNVGDFMYTEPHDHSILYDKNKETCAIEEITTTTEFHALNNIGQQYKKTTVYWYHITQNREKKVIQQDRSYIIPTILIDDVKISNFKIGENEIIKIEYDQGKNKFVNGKGWICDFPDRCKIYWSDGTNTFGKIKQISGDEMYELMLNYDAIPDAKIVGGKRKRKSRRNRKSRQNQRKKSRQSRRR